MKQSENRKIYAFKHMYQQWLKLHKMTEDYFREESNNADHIHTFINIVLSVLIAAIINSLSMSISNPMAQEDLPFSINTRNILMYSTLCTVFLSPIMYYVGAGVQYLGTRFFDGKGDYETQIYLQSLLAVPLTLLTGVVTLLTRIPYVGILFAIALFGITIFAVVLNVRIFKAIHKLSTGKAIVSMILVPIAFMFLMFCILSIFLPLFGGAIDKLFESIVIMDGQ